MIFFDFAIYNFKFYFLKPSKSVAENNAFWQERCWRNRGGGSVSPNNGDQTFPRNIMNESHSLFIWLILLFISSSLNFELFPESKINTSDMFKFFKFKYMRKKPFVLLLKAKKQPVPRFDNCSLDVFRYQMQRLFHVLCYL